MVAQSHINRTVKKEMTKFISVNVNVYMYMYIHVHALKETDQGSASCDTLSLPSARMRSEGTVVGSVCLCVCVSVRYSTSHFSNVRSSHKRYDLLNGQLRSENLCGFL